MKKATMTLAQLKDNIFRALDEYSVNGTVMTGKGGMRADIEKRIIPSINSQIRKIDFCFPEREKEITYSFCPLETVCFKDALELNAETRFQVSVPANVCGIYFELCGEVSFNYLLDGYDFAEPVSEKSDFSGRKVVQRVILPTYIDDTTKYEIVFFTQTYAKITNLTVYARTDAHEKISEQEHMLIPAPGYMTAYLPDDFMEMKYAFQNDKRLLSDEFIFTEDTVSVRGGAPKSVCIKYTPVPQTFTEEKLDEKIDLPYMLCEALVYAVAADVCPVEEQVLFSHLNYKYQDIMANYYSKETPKAYQRNSFFARAKRRLGG